jgi:hypothetical protein
VIETVICLRAAEFRLTLSQGMPQGVPWVDLQAHVPSTSSCVKLTSWDSSHVELELDQSI